MEPGAQVLAGGSVPPGTLVHVGQQRPRARAKAMISGLPKPGAVPVLEGTLRTAAGPSLGGLAHRSPGSRAPCQRGGCSQEAEIAWQTKDARSPPTASGPLRKGAWWVPRP